MQRKIIQIIVVISLLLLYTGSVFADYPRYLNGDPNCIIFAGHMGTGWYLKKNSVQVVSENGPVTELTVEVLTVPNAYDGNVNYSNIKKYSFYYDESTQTSINSGMSPQKVMGYYDRNGTLSYVDPKGSMAEIRITLPAGEMAFAIKYHKKFYGNGIYQFGQDFYRGVLY